MAMETKTVYVSLNYRLNAFGFLALEELTWKSSSGTSGNYGFMDQILALQWVKHNIHAFGGNPNRVSSYSLMYYSMLKWELNCLLN